MGTLYPKREKKKNNDLWWIIIIALVVTISIYISLGNKAEIDLIVEKQRLTVLFVGFMITGICGICIFYKNWYRSK